MSISRSDTAAYLCPLLALVVVLLVLLAVVTVLYFNKGAEGCDCSVLHRKNSTRIAAAGM